jgi:hypothetical protein
VIIFVKTGISIIRRMSAGPERIGKLYDTLRDARNLLAHSHTLPDEPEAVEYVRQTSYLRAILQILKESLKPKADKSGEEK